MAFVLVPHLEYVVRRSAVAIHDGGASWNTQLLGFDATSFFQSHRLANAIAEEIQLGPTNDAAAFDFDLGNPWAVQRKFSLDAFTGNNPANREHFAAARAAFSDHGATENLDAFLGTFQNFVVDVDSVPNFKLRNVFLEAGLLDHFHDQMAHTESAELKATGGLNRIEWIEKTGYESSRSWRRAAVRARIWSARH